MRERINILYYVRNYRFNSIFIKNLIAILLFIVLPLISICVVTYVGYAGIIQKEIQSSNAYILTKANDMTETIFKEADKLSYTLASNMDIINFSSSAINRIMNYDTATQIINIEHLMGTLKLISEHIESVYLYSETNNFVITSEYGSSSLEKVSDKNWYDIYRKMKDHSNFWISAREVPPPTTESDGPRHLISLFRITPLYDTRKLGVIVINIDMNKLGDFISDVSNQRFEKVLIIDKDNNIIYSNDNTQINHNFSDFDDLENLQRLPEQPIIIKSNNTSKVITFSKPSAYYEHLISVVPLTQYEDTISYIRRYMAFLLLVSIVIAVVLSFVLSIKVFRPIADITNILHNADDWVEFQQNKDRKQNHLNEYKYIVNSIINTYTEQWQIKKELSERLEILRRAQAIALQSQINPHFLYNTLETINWKALRLNNGNNEISDMVTSLSKLLRIALETENNLIPLHLEIEHTKCYIDIQKSRYKNKFDVIWNVDQGIVKYKSVKIILQPLIENSIYHGIKPKRENGTITINGYEKDKEVVLEVIDDGVGIDEQQLALLKKSINFNPNDPIGYSEHIGLKNVCQRLRLMFVEECEIIVESKKDEGMMIRIIMPIVE